MLEQPQIKELTLNDYAKLPNNQGYIKGYYRLNYLYDFELLNLFNDVYKDLICIKINIDYNPLLLRGYIIEKAIKLIEENQVYYIMYSSMMLTFYDILFSYDEETSILDNDNHILIEMFQVESMASVDYNEHEDSENSYLNIENTELKEDREFLYEKIKSTLTKEKRDIKDLNEVNLKGFSSLYELITETPSSITHERNTLEFKSFINSIELKNNVTENKNVENQSIEVNSNDTTLKPKFTTKITPTELTELVKALIENGNIRGVQKEILNDFSNFFDTEIKSPNNRIQSIKNREAGNESIFLDNLKASLLEFTQKQN